jgi:hypothetical protein
VLIASTAPANCPTSRSSRRFASRSS